MSAAGDAIEAWRPLTTGAPGERAILDELAGRYAEAHRRYHGVGHIGALARAFAWVAEAGPGWLEPREVQLAILFHDAIYEPLRADNEARSAQLARARLSGWSGVDVERVAAMIEATAAHGLADTEGDPDLAHFLDADTAILGAPPSVYDRYAEGVRQEFAAVPESLYVAGRRRFLSAQLERERLYHSASFGDRHEHAARANLRRELASLGQA
ncbi:hypothetical protein PPSIR1_23519 [Plesiocystis pacifica SIR-1]|uniref:N-methyl-D-aspartate receptor NMDAR2C subunit n=1 Tax=Plesiocystis pacifica SIR-1 TaxID=391625 RepID=A6G7U6_9BACT|nr:hypothetical protein PPSIR1_23519 [Plesiocystis pacifica SIR-1]